MTERQIGDKVIVYGISLEKMTLIGGEIVAIDVPKRSNDNSMASLFQKTKFHIKETSGKIIITDNEDRFYDFTEEKFQQAQTCLEKYYALHKEMCELYRRLHQILGNPLLERGEGGS